MKAVQQNVAFYPTEFEEEKAEVVQVTVEIDEVVYYTSEEEADSVQDQ